MTSSSSRQPTSRSRSPPQPEPPPVLAHAITVSARKLQDILRALPEGSAIALDLQEKRLQIKAGKSKFSLQTLPAQDFPKLAAAGGEAPRSSWGRANSSSSGLVQYAMAQQDIRYYLNGMLLSLSPDGLTVVATDGHRLALATPAGETSVPQGRR